MESPQGILNNLKACKHKYDHCLLQRIETDYKIISVPVAVFQLNEYSDFKYSKGGKNGDNSDN